ncbi:MAG TPA: prolyl oligopeptidase family serine peptidase, partial [Planctomycetaceae bacterium]|nr:prolyl oligopeptidase family serine peptidase [Planctomycetaceae bacterium]
SMKAAWDNIRAVDLLSSLEEVDAERIGVIGHSLGGHNAIFTAVFEPRLKVIVSSCGFSTMTKDDVPSWTGPRYMPRIASEFGNDAKRLPFDFPGLTASLAPRAVFISAATKDDDFDLTGVQDCVRLAQPIFDLYKASAELHAIYPDSPHDFPLAARQAAYEFIDRHLRSDP